MRKSSVLIFVLCVIYLLANIFAVVLVFGNADKLGVRFWPTVGLIFLFNISIQAIVLRQRELRAIQVMFADDVAYAEFRESIRIFRRRAKNIADGKSEIIS